MDPARSTFAPAGGRRVGGELMALVAGGQRGLSRSMADRFRPSPRKLEAEAVEQTVYAGLYDRRPEVEHCGAIFIWTRFYLNGEE